MSATYDTTLAQLRLQAIIDRIGAGGKLVIGTSALNGAVGVLATFTLDTPPATYVGRVLTWSGLPKFVASTAGGIAAKAEVRKSDGTTVVISGLTVGNVGSACDLIVDTTAIVNARNVYWLSGTITHP